MPTALEQLRALAADAASRSAFSPLGQHSFLLFDADVSGVSTAEQEHLAAWLRQLPCPVLAIAPAVNVLARASDVMLPDPASADPLLAQIRRSPMAASVLVQLLRATENLELEAGLTAESLAYSTLQAGPEFRVWLQQHPSHPRSGDSDNGDAVLTQRDGNSLRLELNRPSNHNAMSVEMRDALMQALQLVMNDDSIEQVQISGRGKCFSAGGDLAEFGSAPDPATAHLVRHLALPGRLLAQCAARVTVIVHGACIGSGIEFPSFAGRIVAKRDAHFQLPELRFGLIPGAGGCIGIARRIGRQRTAWLALSGKRIHAPRALEWGLVDALTPD